MEGFWRHPALPVGVVLLILGVGNWMVSRDKVQEYSRRADLAAPQQQTESLHEFKRLTPRTNATVLERLHRRMGDYGMAAAKRDFYSVLQSGGRFITVAGLLSIGCGLLGRWRERRVMRAAGHGLAPRGAPPAPERA
jgi:hypothetical protein